MFKNIRISFVGIGIMVSLGCYYYLFGQNTASTTKTSATTIEKVATGALKDTIDVVGTANLVDEQSLRFNKEGTVTKINFKQGDSVKAGQIIAEIDNSDGENSIKEAQISLENAKIALQELYTSPDESKILQAKNTITTSQNNLETAQKELENLKITQVNSLADLQNNIQNLQKELLSAQNALELSKKDLELSKNDLTLTLEQQQNSLSNTNSNKSTTIAQIENSFASDLTSVGKIIEQVDYVLGITDGNKSKNDAYEIYLSAKNPEYKNQATVSFGTAYNSYQSLSDTVGKYVKNGDIQEIKNILSQFQQVYKNLENTTNLTYKVLENTVASSDLSENELESKKSTIYNYLTTVQSKLNSITSSLNTLDTLTNTDLITSSNNNTIISKQNAIAQKEESIKTSQIAIEKKIADIQSKQNELQTTKQNYEITLKNKNDSISQLQKTLQLNQVSLKELLEGPTSENVTKAKNNITQAELKLKSAQESLDDYKLEAPFDGVVKKIDYMIGDKLTNETDKYVYIENPDLLEITVMLDQVDIAKVDLKTQALITFDAYPTQKVKGVITQIDTTPVQSSGVTSYTVTLVLNDPTFKKKVLSGMTADVEIIVSESPNALVISSAAVTTKDDKSYITLMKNGVPSKTEIVTGIVSDGKTEILSGASLGDQVVITSYTTSSTKTTSTSLFGGGGNNRSGSAGGPPGGF